MPYYNKHGVGKRKSLVYNGKTYERKDWYLVKIGEQEHLVEAMDDPDHFIVELNPIITRMEYESYRRKGVPIPRRRLGICHVCSCGSGAAMIQNSTDGTPIPDAFKNKLVCQSFVQYGKHQTSFTIKDGQMHLDKITAQDHLLSDAELDNLYGTPEQNYQKMMDESNSK